MNKQNRQILYMDLLKLWIGFNIGFVLGAYYISYLGIKL